jgi:hypothetical protein
VPFHAKRFWLYVRLAGLGLVILFAAQLLLVNIPGDGQAKLLPWMTGNNLTALLAAFALGLLAVRILKASVKAWRDLEAHLDERRQAADETAQAGQAPAAREEGERPAEAPAADKQWTPAQLRSPGGARDKRSAADVRTGGEDEEGEKAQARPK